MKFILLIISFTLGIQSFSFEEETPIQTSSWALTGIGLDSTIEDGFAVIHINVFDTYNSAPLANSKIYVNDELNGVTDVGGFYSKRVKIGATNFKTITSLGLTLTKYQKISNQKIYTYQVNIYNSPKLVPIPNPNPIQVQPCKPVIYLYPKKKQYINVKVLPKDEFLFTYPKYPSDGWSVIAYPNGKIEYKNRTYNYLFWEGVSSAEYNIDDSLGFEVDSDTLIQFFEHTLTKIGLTTEEQTDFITYWGPKLQENQLNFIHFEFTEGCEKNIAKLEITPKPDQVIRIFMTYHYIDELEYKPTQQIPTYKRKGFTVVEWGGSYYE